MDQQFNPQQQQPYQQPYQQQQQDVPNSTSVLVLGICSLVICGLGPILGTITLVLSGSAKRAYEENPSLYKQTSYNNVNTGRICGLIGLILGCCIWIFYIVYFIFVISMFSAVAGGAFH
jgi:hypothetical protein